MDEDGLINDFNTAMGWLDGLLGALDDLDKDGKYMLLRRDTRRWMDLVNAPKPPDDK